MPYAAQPSRQAYIDLGPETEWTPEGRELRQLYQRGLTSFFDYAQRQHTQNPVPPILGLGQAAPEYQQYFDQMRLIAARNPAYASALAREAEMVGIMSDRFKGSTLMLQKGLSPLGQGFYVPLLPGPAASIVDYAGAGVPVRYHYPTTPDTCDSLPAAHFSDSNVTLGDIVLINELKARTFGTGA